MIQLNAPFTEEKVRNLKLGDQVEITGIVFTGRDAVHKWLSEGNNPPVSFENGIIYHCGPVVMPQGAGAKKGWKVTAAGPTTSIREEPYQAGVIERLKVRAVIGKGGMGEKTRLACQQFGCVYLHAIGGAAQVLAEKIVKVQNVYMLEKFGSPEAIWQLEVLSFPAVVTIDAHGNSLHREIDSLSKSKFEELLKR